MSVDFEAIARHERCDASSLRNALPLLEQGYLPPFLARYRRDELNGLSETALWALLDAVRYEEKLRTRREELLQRWQKTAIQDPAIESAIQDAANRCVLDRVARRLRGESTETAQPAQALAARLLSPQSGDSGEPSKLATALLAEHAEAAVAGLDHALADRIGSDPRLIQAGVRWLAKNARIQILEVADPHGGEDGPDDEAGPTKNSDHLAAKAEDKPAGETPELKPVAEGSVSDEPKPEAPVAVESPATETVAAVTTDAAVATDETVTADETVTTDETVVTEVSATADDVMASGEATATEPTAAPPPSDPDVATGDPTTAESEATESPDGVTSTVETTAASTPNAEESPRKARRGKKDKSGKPKDAAAKASRKKKISPRQRRRRWLVGVLQPLSGKTHSPGKLTAFQKVMLGRALRSQVAKCAFQYDAAKLTAHLQKFAAQLNPAAGGLLQETVGAHEATIRETCEGAWWDELLDAAANRLVYVAAGHLRKQMLREPVTANVVLSIDAIGPQTVALAVVTADGRLLATEDLPCQLSSAARQQAVTRLGELLHQYHVDLIVVSNGPARRPALVLLNELLEQSQQGSIRWALADRSGADLYAGGPVGNREMRSTPRRFRAATWLAFQVLSPAQALTKVDPTKLRLGSFQRELADEALEEAVNDVLISGVSSDGVDVNGVDPSWLARLPGMSDALANEIDDRRRQALIASRETLDELPWPDAVARNQAVPFLRVFGSSQTLDGTLIHPNDYALAEKLMQALELPAPPASPPGYTAPDYSAPVAEPSVTPTTESTSTSEAEAEPSDAAPMAATESTSDAVAEGSIDESETPTVEASVEASLPAEVAAETPPTTDEVAADETAAETVAAETSEAESGPESEGDSNVEGDLNVEGFRKPVKETPVVPAPEPVTVIPPYRHPLPDSAEIQKRVKEWQIGRHRATQIVRWVCDPFTAGTTAMEPSTATMERVPKLSELQPGTKVAGIVVGVAGFGVFVELGPDCNGLVHVSRLSDRFVEDMNEAVQVGDVLVAWVTGVDTKRRRVALSAVSPEREAEVAALRQAQNDDRGPRGRGSARHGDGPPRGGANRSGAGTGSGAPVRDQGRGAPNRGGQGRGDAGGRPAGGRGRGGDGRSGRGRDGGRRGDREATPRVYTKVARNNDPPPPISEAMEKGEEPMRSFGDLAQFLQKKSTPPAKPEAKPPASAKPVEAPKPVEPAEPKVESAPSNPSAEPTPPTDAASSADVSSAAEPNRPPHTEAAGEATPAPTDAGEQGSES